jgi:nitroreductase
METCEFDNFLELVKKRRSIRRFKSDSIPDHIINKIIEAASWAPSGFHTQPWEFVILKEEADRKKIVEITAASWEISKELEKARPAWQGKKWGMKGMTNEPGDYSQAPVYILLIGDKRPLDALPMCVQCDPNNRDLIYWSSLSNAFLQMHLAATTLGLGAQWYSTVQVPANACLIKEYLGIPQEFDVFDMMILGYPAAKPPKKVVRKQKEMVHWGKGVGNEMRSQDQVRDFVKRTRNWVMGAHAKKTGHPPKTD